MGHLICRKRAWIWRPEALLGPKWWVASPEAGVMSGHCQSPPGIGARAEGCPRMATRRNVTLGYKQELARLLMWTKTCLHLFWSFQRGTGLSRQNRARLDMSSTATRGLKPQSLSVLFLINSPTVHPVKAKHTQQLLCSALKRWTAQDNRPIPASPAPLLPQIK